MYARRCQTVRRLQRQSPFHPSVPFLFLAWRPRLPARFWAAGILRKESHRFRGARRRPSVAGKSHWAHALQEQHDNERESIGVSGSTATTAKTDYEKQGNRRGTIKKSPSRGSEPGASLLANANGDANADHTEV